MVPKRNAQLGDSQITFLLSICSMHYVLSKFISTEYALLLKRNRQRSEELLFLFPWLPTARICARIVKIFFVIMLMLKFFSSSKKLLQI